MYRIRIFFFFFFFGGGGGGYAKISNIFLGVLEIPDIFFLFFFFFWGGGGVNGRCWCRAYV